MRGRLRFLCGWSESGLNQVNLQVKCRKDVVETNPRGDWVQKIVYGLVVNEEEDGIRVTGTSGILFLERGRRKQTGFVRKKSRKKGEMARRARNDCDVV